MKKLLLLPTVLFVMLIAAMVNPFGCREKKSGIIVIDHAVLLTDTPRLISIDTLPNWVTIDTISVFVFEKSNREFHVSILEIQGDNGSRARLDTFGKWHIQGECSNLLEAMLRINKTSDSLKTIYMGQIDSLKREIYNIKAKQAEYMYAGKKKEAGTFAFYGKSLAELPDSIIEMLTGSLIAKPDTIFKNQ